MKPVVIPRPQHTISRKLIDPDALRVMYRLLRGGHHAYLVGGAVRDLLLGRTPKDFDVGTDAHPHQVKKLFRNCRLVGRRFRLAHVHFGGKIIEVSTFRRRSEFRETAEPDDRLIRSDNTFGTPEEDALRRDFTINGLFYDLETFSVLDYVGGIPDLQNRIMRCIGTPRERIPEDPVRILRAVKFAARLDFQIEEKLAKSMTRFAPDIRKCALARVLEEIYRLLRGGAAGAAFQLMEECGALRILFPEVDAYLKKSRENGKDGDREFWHYLDALDELSSEGVELSNALLMGAIAVHLTGVVPGQSRETEISPPEHARNVEALTREWVSRLGLARRDRERLSHMLRAQPRFLRPRGRRFRPRAFVTKHYYPDSEALFALGCRATGLELDTLARWQALRAEAAASQPSEGPKRRRRSRGSRGSRGEARESSNGTSKLVVRSQRSWGRRSRRPRRPKTR
jgi:poly(A) polymerase